MSEVLLLKLGGSVITDKTKTATVRLDVVERLAREIKNALDERGDELRLIIGHGAGSFGHPVAAKYQTHKGDIAPNSWVGFVEVATAAMELNYIIMKALRRAGVPAVRFQPSASIRTRSGKLAYFESFPIKTVLQHGLVPVIHGDVSIDEEQGMSIVSTEKLFTFLARELKPSRIVLAGHVGGVYDGDPLINPATRLIARIDSDNWAEVEASLSGSHGVDVTGGMLSKVRDMHHLITSLPDTQAVIISAEEPGNLEAALKGWPVSGTLIV